MHPALYSTHGLVSRRMLQFLRIGLSAVLLLLIWQHLPAEQLFVSLKTVTSNGLLVVAIVLLPLNYFLEAYKWRALLPPAIRPTHLSALSAVLVGQASGFLTPNRLGDYAGRALWFDKHARLQATGATFSSRLAQLPATLFGGLLACLPLLLSLQASPNWLLIAAVSVAAVMFLALTCLPRFSRAGLALVRRLLLRLLPRQTEQLKRLRPHSRAQLTQLLLLSAVRYLVFTLQYALLLVWLMPDIGWQTALSLPALVFAAKTFIPSFAFAELGIRESLAVAIALLLGVSEQIAFEATLVLFVLNVLLPALSGCFIMLVGGLRNQVMSAKHA